MTTKLEDIIYPECAMRPERFASRFEAIDCANKTARLSAGMMIGLVVVGILIYIGMGNETTGWVWLVGVGAVAIGALVCLASSTIAERKWLANDIKITRIMTMNPALNRAQAAETVVRENMRQEQSEIAQRSADAQSRSANALMLNTGQNAYITFRPQR